MTLTNKPRVTPALGLILAVLAASTSSILIRYAQLEAPSIVVAAYRLILASLLLLPLAVGRYREPLRTMTARERWLSMGAGAFLALHFATWITSLEYTSVASSVMLVQTTPLFVALASPWLLKERHSAILWLALLVAMGGSLTIGVSDLCPSATLQACIQSLAVGGSDALLGDLLALAGALAGAGYMLIGRRVRTSVPLVPYITYTYGSAAVILTVGAIASSYPLWGYSPRMFLVTLLLAIFPQLFAHSTYNWALRYLPAASVSLSLLGEPIASAVWAYVLLEEIPSQLRLAGAFLVLCGILVGLQFSPRTSPKERSNG